MKTSGSSPGRVSIAMATYNGEAHLGEQIHSLFFQRRLPDQLVVYDDASTDETVTLLHRLAEQAPFDMQVVAGDGNRGVNAAFQSALARCSGDVVFFCDQDDIWLPHKIEACMHALQASPHAGFVFCDATQFKTGVGHLDLSLWQLAKFTRRRQAAFRRDPLGTLLTGGNIVYGMAAAFRRDLVARFEAIDCHPAGMTHDTWFALHAAATGFDAVALPERLVRYRRHAAQTSVINGSADGLDRQANIGRAQSRAAALIAALRLVRRNVEREMRLRGTDATAPLAALDRKIGFLETREAMRRDRRLGQALRGILDADYWRLASGPASVLRDYRGIW